MTSALRWRDGSGINYPATPQLLALPADVCVVRLALRAAGGPGRRESRRQVAPGAAQHLLDQHHLDRRSGHEEVYDFRRPRQGHAQARKVVRRSGGGPLDTGEPRTAELAGSVPAPAKGWQAVEGESSLHRPPGLPIFRAVSEPPG